jgi:hypothetical protein
MHHWYAVQSLGDFGYRLLADLATDWMHRRHAIQSLGDFGYMGTYVGRNKALRSYGTPRSLLGLNRLVSQEPAYQTIIYLPHIGTTT